MNALRRLLPHALALAALGAIPLSGHAALTVHTTPASFHAAVVAPATDSFDAQEPGGPVFPHIGSAGPYGYSADAAFDGIYFVGSAADLWMSTTSPAEHIVFYDFTIPVQAIAGLFFATDFDGNVLPGLDVTLTAFDGSSTTTYTLSNTTASSFVGLVSDLPLISLSVQTSQPAFGDAFMTVNDLTLAASAVPEPATSLLWLAGLLAGGFAVRRRAAA